jgi:hypothetical protein
MNKIILFTLGIFAFLIFTNIDVYACSCIPRSNETIQQQVNQAKTDAQAVFSGRVLQIIRKPETYQTIVKLRVENFWKGNLSKEVTVTTGSDSALCGYKFEVGQSYLIYANGVDVDNLQTNICTRTAKFSEAKADVKVLGKGKSLRKSR